MQRTKWTEFMKRIICIVLASLLVLSMTACGKAPTDSSGTTSPSTQAAGTPTTTPTNAPADTTATAPTTPTTTPTTASTNTSHTNHTFGDWTTKATASCKKEGEQIRRCTQCSFTESRPIAKLEHSFNAQRICKKCYYVEFDENAPLVELGVICDNWYDSGSMATYPWDIKVWNGKVYRGAGDYDKNSGATTILAYDIATHTWDTTYKAKDEAIHGFEVINGTLCAPGIDAQESWDYGNYYTLDKNGNWQKNRNLPNGVHNFDMIEYNGKIFAGLGTETVGDTVAVSSDGGKSFTFASLYKDGQLYNLSKFDHSRTYEFTTLNGTVYALIALYPKSGTTEWGIYRYEDGKMHYTAAGQTLLEGKDFSRKYFGGTFEMNGTCYLTARRLYAIQDFSDPSKWSSISMPNQGKVSDAILKDGVIYVLSSRQNKDKTYHTIIYKSTTGQPGSFVEAAVYDYSGFPLSFDFDGTHFYVGTSSNSLDKSKIGMVLRVKANG